MLFFKILETLASNFNRQALSNDVTFFNPVSDIMTQSEKPYFISALTAVDLLKAGETVALPTETVYGLAADARNAAAVNKIYRLKNRPHFNPLIVHALDLKAARSIAEFSPLAEKLSHAFQPGALTLVLPLKAEHGLAPAVTAGLPTVAIRIPAAPLMRTVLEEFGGLLAAPSANPSGAVSPARPEHVIKSFFNTFLPILDGGPCTAGLESTILSVTAEEEIYLLRPGPVTAEEITTLTGKRPLSDKGKGGVTAPGQLKSHYAPSVKVRLNAADVKKDEGFLAFGAESVPQAAKLIFQLSEKGDLEEAARNLFEGLHYLDAKKPDSIAVAPVPAIGKGAAINDRLTRAAADKDGT